jgi:transcriptional regulator with XRE-family HTH domain
MQGNLYSNFGSNLKRIISEKDISQASVARKLGTSPMQVSRWITGRNAPPLKTFCELCRVLQVKPGVFFEEIIADDELFNAHGEPRQAQDSVMREWMEFKRFERLRGQFLKAS